MSKLSKIGLGIASAALVSHLYMNHLDHNKNTENTGDHNPNYMHYVKDLLARKIYALYTPDSSIKNFAELPDHPWVKDFAKLSHEQAVKKIADCYEDLCKSKYADLDSNDEFIARGLVLETMYQDGLDEKELQVFRQYITTIELPHNTPEDDRINAVMDKILESPEYQRIKKYTSTPYKLDSQSIEFLHYQKDFVLTAINAFRTAFEMPEVEIKDSHNPEKAGLSALTEFKYNYTNKKLSLAFTFNYASTDAHDPYKLLNNIAHEYKHAMDYYAMAEAHKNRLTTQDPRLPHILTFIANARNYTPACMEATHECNAQNSIYSTQYIEHIAFKFGAHFVEKFKEKEQQPKASQATPLLVN